MAKPKHTPGPYRVENSSEHADCDFSITAGPTGDQLLAHVSCFGTSDAVEATARLLAAAPDLLDALRDLLELYESDEACQGLPQYCAAVAAVYRAQGTVITGGTDHDSD